jgi:predicted porin|tara:strand:+ start:99 stop:491 length:393 start_codon:yes stop_codon:yes gene_type:complete
MKEIILTTIIALFCFSASAQYRVLGTINEPSDGESWGVENLTSNIGVGYQINDDIMLGVQKSNDDYDIVGRYSLTDMFYLSGGFNTEEGIDNITLGLGASIKVWDKLYIEPNYTRKDDDGSLNMGLSYKL